jgi:hypothetical protein
MIEPLSDSSGRAEKKYLATMTKKKKLTLLPSQQLVQQIWDYLVTRPPKRGEQKKALLECLFLLS